jgi:hypothetical protein
MRVPGPDEMQHAHVAIDGVFLFGINNLGLISGVVGTGKYRQSRPNEINHLRVHSYRLEYRPTRPVTEPLSHAGSGHFQYSRFGLFWPSALLWRIRAIPKKVT